MKIRQSRKVLLVFTSILFAAVMAATPGRGATLRVDLGPNFNTLSGDLVSEHVPWARPLPGGPIRTLFCVPRMEARDAVELAQRVDLDYESILFFKANVFGHSPSPMDIVGAGTEEKTVRLREKLAGHWDLIVVGKVHWEAFPDFARERIMELVEGGAALLVVYPDASFKALVSDMEREDAPAFGEMLPLAAVAPFAGLKDPAATLAASVRLFGKGKGRVALELPGPLGYQAPRAMRWHPRVGNPTTRSR